MGRELDAPPPEVPEVIETADDFAALLESLDPTDYLTATEKDRPYDGQPHTITGERGRTEISGITFRDLRDAYVRACFRASGLSPSEWPASLYDLPWPSMDPLAVAQNLGVEVEVTMGIFPNLPGKRPT